jgi:hypothetical protein
MKDLTKYIQEGLFDTDAIEKTSDSLYNYIKVTYYCRTDRDDVILWSSDLSMTDLHKMFESVTLDGEEIDYSHAIFDLTKGEHVAYFRFNKDASIERLFWGIGIEITKIEIDLSTPIKSFYRAFSGISYEGNKSGCEVIIKNINLEHCDIVANMFENSARITSVIFENSIGSENLDGFDSMFINCENIKHIDLSGLSFKNIKTFTNTFNGCKNLTTLVFPQEKIHKVNYITRMFNSCKSIESIDLSFIDLTNIRGFVGVFNDCYNIKEIIFDNNSTPDFYKGFDQFLSGCLKLKKITIPKILKSRVKVATTKIKDNLEIII